jgi:hypothetical protein
MNFTLTISITLVMCLVCHSFGVPLSVVHLLKYGMFTGVCNRLPPTLMYHEVTVVK